MKLEERIHIVQLRKAGTSLRSISKEVGYHITYIRAILKEELGDDYDKYSLRIPKKTFTKEQIKEVVNLRTTGSTLLEINEVTHISTPKIRNILKTELGAQYYVYSHTRRYVHTIEAFKEELPQIIELRERGNSLHEIKNLTGFSLWFITRFLTENSSETLFHRNTRNYNNLTKDEVAEEFQNLYDAITHIKELKSECMTAFISLWEKLKHKPKYRNPQLLGPVFTYCFFKTKSVNLALKDIQKRFEISTHDWFKCLKHIYPHFPEYKDRNRKLLVTQKLFEITSRFNYNSKFVNNSILILDSLWNYINNTTEIVIVGIVAVLSALSIKEDDYQIHPLCKELGVMQSTLIYQMRKLCNQLSISGFTTLRQSYALICTEILEKRVGLSKYYTNTKLTALKT